MKTLKSCITCKKIKELNRFSKDKSHKDGHRTCCKNCCIKYWKIYRRKNYYTIHAQAKEARKIFKKCKPYQKSYHSAKQRCNNPNNATYIYYGGKGIKMLMTSKDFKYLWFRDKAYLMKQPSIDRKDSDGNYTLENCRFIEMDYNRKRRFYK